MEHYLQGKERNKMPIGSFKKNTFWLVFQQFFGIALALIVGPLVARTLGPEGVGDMAYAENIVTMFFTISQLGMNNILVAELIAAPEKEGKTIGTALFLRIVSSLVFIGLSIATAFILKPNHRIIQMSTIIQSTMILMQLFDVFNYWFQSKLLSKYFTWISMFSLVIFNGYRIYHVVNHGSVLDFSYANTIRYAIILVLLAIVFFKMNPGIKLEYDKETAKRILSRSRHFVAATIGSIIYVKVDGLMVGSMINSESLGYYSLAVTLCSIWELVPTSIIASAQPVILENRKIGEKEYLDTYQLSLLGIFLLSTFVTLMALLFGRWVILFLYGSAFEKTVPIFYIIVASTIFGLLDAARSTWIISEKYEKQAKYFVYLGAIVDIVLNYFLIQKWGAIGAALATLVTQLVVFFVAPLMFRETRRHNQIFFGCFKQWPFLYQLIKKNIQMVVRKISH